MFTTAVLRQSIREKDNAWRHLGFLPCQYKGITDDGDMECSAQKSLQMHHECLSVLLHDFYGLQQSPPLLSFDFFGCKEHVRLILQVAFVAGDQLSQDTHCGRMMVNNGGAGRLHRGCDASFLHGPDTRRSCNTIKRETIETMTRIVMQYDDKHQRDTLVDMAFPLPGIDLPVESQTATDVDADAISINGDQRSVTECSYQSSGDIQIDRECYLRFLKLRSKMARLLLQRVYCMYPIQNAWTPVQFGSNPALANWTWFQEPLPLTGKNI